MLFRPIAPKEPVAPKKPPIMSIFARRLERNSPGYNPDVSQPVSPTPAIAACRKNSIALRVTPETKEPQQPEAKKLQEPKTKEPQELDTFDNTPSAELDSKDLKEEKPLFTSPPSATQSPPLSPILANSSLNRRLIIDSSPLSKNNCTAPEIPIPGPIPETIPIVALVSERPGNFLEIVEEFFHLVKSLLPCPKCSRKGYLRIDERRGGRYLVTKCYAKVEHKFCANKFHAVGYLAALYPDADFAKYVRLMHPKQQPVKTEKKPEKSCESEKIVLEEEDFLALEDMLIKTLDRNQQLDEQLEGMKNTYENRIEKLEEKIRRLAREHDEMAHEHQENEKSLKETQRQLAQLRFSDKGKETLDFTKIPSGKPQVSNIAPDANPAPSIKKTPGVIRYISLAARSKDTKSNTSDTQETKKANRHKGRDQRAMSKEQVASIMEKPTEKKQLAICSVVVNGLKAERLGLLRAALTSKHVGIPSSRILDIAIVSRNLIEFHVPRDYKVTFCQRLLRHRPDLQFLEDSLDPRNNPNDARLAARETIERLESCLSKATTSEHRSFVQNYLEQAKAQLKTGKYNPVSLQSSS